MTETWLVADVGGTNSRLGPAMPHGLIAGSSASFANDAYPEFDRLVAEYLAGQGAKITALCAGVAGPVRAGRAQLTNRDWQIDADRLAQTTGATRVTLINDLQAQGYALDDLDAARLTPIWQAAPPPPHATRMVLGLGTGCNIAVTHDLGTHLFVPPAEAGHSRLPHLADLALAMARLEMDHLPVEAFLSGPGLSRLHKALHDEDASPTEILTGHSPAQRDTRAAATTLLGQVLGNFATIHLPMGGIFLIGGLARALLPRLDTTTLRANFTQKGPYRAILDDIPLSLITDDDAALRGCARLLRQG